MSRCRSCNREITFVQTESGRLAPFEEDPAGMWVLVDGVARLPGMFDEDEQRWTSHFATCDDPTRFRKS